MSQIKWAIWKKPTTQSPPFSAIGKNYLFLKWRRAWLLHQVGNSCSSDSDDESWKKKNWWEVKHIFLIIFTSSSIWMMCSFCFSVYVVLVCGMYVYTQFSVCLELLPKMCVFPWPTSPHQPVSTNVHLMPSPSHNVTLLVMMESDNQQTEFRLIP